MMSVRAIGCDIVTYELVILKILTEIQRAEPSWLIQARSQLQDIGSETYYIVIQTTVYVNNVTLSFVDASTSKANTLIVIVTAINSLIQTGLFLQLD